jgi:hypothetical protein
VIFYQIHDDYAIGSQGNFLESGFFTETLCSNIDGKPIQSQEYKMHEK